MYSLIMAFRQVLERIPNGTPPQIYHETSFTEDVACSPNTESSLPISDENHKVGWGGLTMRTALCSMDKSEEQPGNNEY